MFREKRRCIQNHDAPDQLRMARGKPKPDRTAPIVDNQMNAFQSKQGNQRLDIGDARCQAIIVILWFLRKAHAHMIRRNATEGGRQGAHDVAVEKRPRGIAVQHQHGLVATWPFVEIAHPRAEWRRERARLEGIVSAKPGSQRRRGVHSGVRFVVGRDRWARRE